MIPVNGGAPPFFRPPVTRNGPGDPFGLPDVEAYVPPGPPPLDSEEYAAAFNEVKDYGAKFSPSRTPDQTQIAMFWSDFSYTATPAGHWDEIATSIARARQADLAENARLFALLSIAQADAAIVCWDAKFRNNAWRPVTAIQRADEDGNAATEADKTWTALLGAPSFPEYTSGHSTFTAASAQVLARFYGTDAISFTARSESLPGVFRSFNSLSACADEVGMSRIYGGIHFQFSNRDGKACGRLIGEYAIANYLLPNSSLPLLRPDRTSSRKPAFRVQRSD